MRSITTGSAIAAVICGLLPSVAMAENRVSFGLGAAPDYVGSNDLRAIPMPGFAFDLGEVAVKSSGIGIEADIAPALGAPRGFQFGPILRYDLGRNDGSKVADAVVSRMAPVRAAPEIGGFVGVGVPLTPDAGLLGTARLSVRQGVGGGHQGGLAEASLGMLRRAGPWTLGGQVTASAGSGAYQGAMFGVSAADSVATGLATYTAKGGLRDVGVAGFAAYAVNDRVAVNLIAGVSRLSAGAANSPLVADRGARDQTFVGLGLTYTFD